MSTAVAPDRASINALFAPAPAAEPGPAPQPRPGPAPAPAVPVLLGGELIGLQVVDGREVFVYPGGAFFPASDLGPCSCGRLEFELVRRWITRNGEKKGDEETEVPSVAVLCPECLPLKPGRRDGRYENVHGRTERRELLGWVDGRTGAIELATNGEGAYG